ncbi:MAG: chemotaxis protein CheW [Betaproteobacteria bacterium]|nr:chemotaxis protein CheW [Betaproteobacteria bacterium]PWB60243.1 MAG: chemotaxis protein CheW [Betaproteobacteria bacterium]
MARRTGLREFQISVAERLRTAATRAALSSKLGFQVGGANWFVALHQVSEVIPMPAFIPVPLTQPWFRGVANVRGSLYSIVDFSAFQGGDPASGGTERRVILVSDKLVGGAGLLVSRMLGLRNPENFTAADRPADAPPWLGAVVRDASGTTWHELDLARLAKERRFLEVGSQ